MLIQSRTPYIQLLAIQYPYTINNTRLNPAPAPASAPSSHYIPIFAFRKEASSLPPRLPFRSPRLSTKLPLLHALKPLRLPRIPLILARPILRQPGNILHKPIHTPLVHPIARQPNHNPKCQSEHQVDPEHYRAVRHAQDLKGDEEGGDENKDGSDVRLGCEAQEEGREVGLGGFEDTEERGYGGYER